MEQKRYIYEIVLLLLKKQSHIREIAKELSVNHMMVLRKMQELKQENAVDFKQEGRNKVYFLKKTPEARTYVFQSEHYKLLKILEKYSNLRRVVELIQSDKRISLAVLFGSYAKELAKKNSDVDLYISTLNKNIKKELNLVDSKLNIKIGKYNKESLLIKEIEKDHVIIKGVEEYYEKSKFFD